jgi:hypothetical protein
MYFKNEQMHHLDEHFGDLENNILGKFGYQSLDPPSSTGTEADEQIERLRSCKS